LKLQNKLCQANKKYKILFNNKLGQNYFWHKWNKIKRINKKCKKKLNQINKSWGGQFMNLIEARLISFQLFKKELLIGYLKSNISLLAFWDLLYLSFRMILNKNLIRSLWLVSLRLCIVNNFLNLMLLWPREN